MAEAVTRRRFTIDEYHRMGEAGILGDDERLELIAGHIVVREPIGSRHAGTVDRLTRLWTSRLGDRAIVRVQNPVVLPEDASEVQPDVMLLAPRADFYTTSHPTPADVRLLIEVADTSLLLDRRVKMPLYARGGIRETWLCDLTRNRVDVHRDLTAGRYASVRTFTGAQRLTVEAFPDVSVTVDELLGAPPA
ncbi:MAG TPA: Uma2 family endonuclease [Methylomirabilota bacterium]|jgi:Uma2 family endonuclease